ncbi:gag-pol polyprotein [Cucumis melo var. makuwa]|uniref:Gag-pol polyprotein n=1 Tax=Cucumis melo var. makuwa TaxID=1194695 RepID=A0A5D3C778_CUCMM|nr:gag-pol polyprotein [Cucumis melo var. makuwa]
MGEDETITEFNVPVLDIANESDALGEKMYDSKLVRKVLRSLPFKFNMKVTAIKEANDLSKMKLDELFGISSYADKTGHYRKKEHERGKGTEASKSDKFGKGIRCHECEGFGHIQTECATYLKRKKKGMVATLSDEEDYSESDDEDLGMALISICTMNDEENVQTHDQPKSNNSTEDAEDRKKTKDQEVILQQQERIQDLVEENQSFLSSIVTLKEELAETKHQFEELLKFARMPTNGTSKLDDILDQGRRADDKRGLGFTERDTPATRYSTDQIPEESHNRMTPKKPHRKLQGNADFFSDLIECKVGLVVFEDGGKGKIIGKGTINRLGLPFLLNVRLLQGLAANLISISQLCDKAIKSVSIKIDDAKVTLCNLSKVEEAGLWHKRLGQLSGSTISKVTKADAIIDLPPLSFSSLERCSECPVGKQVKSVHKPKPSRHVKPYSLNSKEKNTGIGRIQTDYGREFENQHFAEFYDNEGIFHEFSAPLKPQQNVVVERRNRTLQEMARVMIHAKHLPIQFWVEALNTACHIHNRVILRSGTTTTSYELWKGRKPNVKYFHIFGSTCFILSDRDHRRNWDSKSDHGIFLGYSANSRAYRVYNQSSKTVMESINVIIDDLGELESTARTNETTYLPSHLGSSRSDMSTSSTSAIHTDTHESEASVSASQHTLEQTAGATDSSKCEIITRKKERKDYAKMVSNVCYTSSLEPTTISAALSDEHWILAMQEELLQFKRNQVWELMPKPPYANIIGTKWIFKNKMDEEGRVIRKS